MDRDEFFNRIIDGYLFCDLANMSELKQEKGKNGGAAGYPMITAIIPAMELLAGRKQPYSLELVATRDNGIRYVTMVPKQEVETIRRTLLSFLPGLKVEETEDYLPELSGVSVGVVMNKLC